MAAAKAAAVRLATEAGVPPALWPGESSAEAFRRLQRERCGESAAHVVGVALGGADDRSLDRCHVECGGGGSGGLSGSGRLPASPGGDRLRDVRSVAAKAFECVHVPRVVADLLRLRDAGVR